MTNAIEEALADRLVKHVEMLANRSTYMSLTEWNTVSNDILEASRALAALSGEGETKQKLTHAYIVTHKGDGRHAAIVYTLEDAAREAIAGMWAGSLEEALEQEDLLHIYEAIRNPESDEWADYDGEEISFSFEDGSLSVMSIPVKVAALSAPTPVSGLTEEEGWQDIGTLPLLEGAQIVKGGTVPYSAAEGLVTECFDGVTTIAPLKKGDRIWPHMHKWRPTSAPSIDWKRVEEARKRHEYAEQKGGDLYAPEYCEWTFSQTHADRAFLLSLLPKEEADNG